MGKKTMWGFVGMDPNSKERHTEWPHELVLKTHRRSNFPSSSTKNLLVIRRL